MSHTPGPWIIDRKKVTVAIRDKHGNYITENVRQLPNQEANARLIAATPELLEACKSAAAHLAEELADPKFKSVHPVGKCPVLDSLREVIAKAEGQ